MLNYISSTGRRGSNTEGKSRVPGGPSPPAQMNWHGFQHDSTNVTTSIFKTIIHSPSCIFRKIHMHVLPCLGHGCYLIGNSARFLLEP